MTDDRCRGCDMLFVGALYASLKDKFDKSGVPPKRDRDEDEEAAYEDERRAKRIRHAPGVFAVLYDNYPMPRADIYNIVRMYESLREHVEEYQDIDTDEGLQYILARSVFETIASDRDLPRRFQYKENVEDLDIAHALAGVYSHVPGRILGIAYEDCVAMTSRRYFWSPLSINVLVLLSDTIPRTPQQGLAQKLLSTFLRALVKDDSPLKRSLPGSAEILTGLTGRKSAEMTSARALFLCLALLAEHTRGGPEDRDYVRLVEGVTDGSDEGIILKRLYSSLDVAARVRAWSQGEITSDSESLIYEVLTPVEDEDEEEADYTTISFPDADDLTLEKVMDANFLVDLFHFERYFSGKLAVPQRRFKFIPLARITLAVLFYAPLRTVEKLVDYYAGTLAPILHEPERSMDATKLRGPVARALLKLLSPSNESPAHEVREIVVPWILSNYTNDNDTSVSWEDDKVRLLKRLIQGNAEPPPRPVPPVAKDEDEKETLEQSGAFRLLSENRPRKYDEEMQSVRQFELANAKNRIVYEGSVTKANALIAQGSLVMYYAGKVSTEPNLGTVRQIRTYDGAKWIDPTHMHWHPLHGIRHVARLSDANCIIVENGTLEADNPLRVGIIALRDIKPEDTLRTTFANPAVPTDGNPPELSYSFPRAVLSSFGKRGRIERVYIGALNRWHHVQKQAWADLVSDFDHRTNTAVSIRPGRKAKLQAYAYFPIEKNTVVGPERVPGSIREERETEAPLHYIPLVRAFETDDAEDSSGGDYQLEWYSGVNRQLLLYWDIKEVPTWGRMRASESLVYQNLLTEERDDAEPNLYVHTELNDDGTFNGVLSFRANGDIARGERLYATKVDPSASRDRPSRFLVTLPNDETVLATAKKFYEGKSVVYEINPSPYDDLARAPALMQFA